MNKKVKSIILSICIFIGLGSSLYYFTIYKPKIDAANFVMQSIGGKIAIKARCVDTKSKYTDIETGKVVPLQQTLEDIFRIEKLCDCTVAKSYDSMKDPEMKDKVVQIAAMPEAKEMLLSLFMAQYTACELEVYEWLKYKYEPVVLE